MKQSEVSLEELRTRVQALEDERAILTTLYRYGHCIDYGLEREWVDLFTEDGVYHRTRRPGQGPSHRHQGRAELAAVVAAHTRAPDKYHKHLLIEPLITLNGDEAAVVSYYTRIDEGKDSPPFILSFGRYRDRLARCPDGRWRFKERVIEREARSPDGGPDLPGPGRRA